MYINFTLRSFFGTYFLQKEETRHSQLCHNYSTQNTSLAVEVTPMALNFYSNLILDAMSCMYSNLSEVVGNILGFIL